MSKKFLWIAGTLTLMMCFMLAYTFITKNELNTNFNTKKSDLNQKSETGKKEDEDITLIRSLPHYCIAEGLAIVGFTAFPQKNGIETSENISSKVAPEATSNRQGLTESDYNSPWFPWGAALETPRFSIKTQEKLDLLFESQDISTLPDEYASDEAFPFYIVSKSSYLSDSDYSKYVDTFPYVNADLLAFAILNKLPPKRMQELFELDPSAAVKTWHMGGASRNLLSLAIEYGDFELVNFWYQKNLEILHSEQDSVYELIARAASRQDDKETWNLVDYLSERTAYPSQQELIKISRQSDSIPTSIEQKFAFNYGQLAPKKDMNDEQQSEKNKKTNLDWQNLILESAKECGPIVDNTFRHLTDQELTEKVSKLQSAGYSRESIEQTLAMHSRLDVERYRAIPTASLNKAKSQSLEQVNELFNEYQIVFEKKDWSAVELLLVDAKDMVQKEALKMLLLMPNTPNYLIARAADNGFNFDVNSLFTAVITRNFSLLDELLSIGVKIDLQDVNGRNALYMAVLGQSSDMFEHLLSLGLKSYPDKLGFNPYEYFILSGYKNKTFEKILANQFSVEEKLYFKRALE